MAHARPDYFGRGTWLQLGNAQYVHSENGTYTYPDTLTFTHSMVGTCKKISLYVESAAYMKYHAVKIDVDGQTIFNGMVSQAFDSPGHMDYPRFLVGELCDYYVDVYAISILQDIVVTDNISLAFHTLAAGDTDDIYFSIWYDARINE